MRHRLPTATLLGLVLLAGCSSDEQGQQAPQVAQPAPPASGADKDLELYRQLLRIHNDEMAVGMGHQILDKYPGSAAATEVRKTLPDIEKRWKAESEKRRLGALWFYQVAPMAGGTQSTAAMYSSQPSGEDHIRLVLRRHTAWGQSAFLFGQGEGFACRGNCTIPTTFDGTSHPIKAYKPSGGEPALMIRDDADFIAHMKNARKVTMQVTLANGKKEAVVFEVGGFDPAKWQPLPKKGKGK